LAAPVVGIASTPDGGGYWLVAADGGIFAFGTATFHGSATGQPTTAIAPTHTGNGYWIATTNGTVTPEGDAANLQA
jgi:hypothetical protein